eukprot:TRINITY_DN57417_c0_g1_i1.p2 TRINITY_DN57417_c0_g1~~TRINITY_DN57417_c0_g1_i1.p2  ORF type:complete len:341 (+),score=69.83 TRINITY_DN57417_c0_g1_i1:87-1025(+)
MIKTTSKDEWRYLTLAFEGGKVEIKMAAEEAKKAKIRAKQQEENRQLMAQHKEEKALREQSVNQRMQYQHDRLNKLKAAKTAALNESMASRTSTKDKDKDTSSSSVSTKKRDPIEHAILQKSKQNTGLQQLNKKLDQKEARRTAYLASQQREAEEYAKQEEERKHHRLAVVQARKDIVANWQEEMRMQTDMNKLEFQMSKMVEKDFQAKKQQERQQQQIARDNLKKEVDRKIIQTQKRLAAQQLRREKEEEKRKQEQAERAKKLERQEWARMNKQRQLAEKKAKRQQMLDSAQRTKEMIEMKKLLKETGLNT